MAIEYLGLSEINGPLIALEGVIDAAFDEIVEFSINDGAEKRLGRIIEIYEDKEKYNNMSKQAFTTSKQFSIKYYGERIIDVYKKALNKEDKTLLTRIKNVIKRV